MILALAFVPVKRVVEYQKYLFKFFQRNSVINEIYELYDWFINNYIDDNSETNKQIGFWNCYERTLKNIPRTSNSIEGFHRHLNNNIDTINPSIISLGNELKLTQQTSEMYLLRSLYCSNEKKFSTSEIYLIAVSFDNYYDTEYLKAVALNFNFPLNN